MIETTLNVIWLGVAAGAFLALPRSTSRARVALLCAVALLFPIISISDDFNANAWTFSNAAALAITVVIAFLLVAIARVHGARERPYTLALATPSDPRSPPRF